MEVQSINELRDLLSGAFRTYRQLRPQLFEALVELNQTLGGPYHLSYQRDPVEGDPSVPPKLRTHVTSNAKLDVEGHPEWNFDNLAVVYTMPETFAPFRNFVITWTN